MFPGVSLLKLFAVMEADLDLNRFVAGDVHLWPIARSCFGAKKVDNNTAPEDRSGDLKRLDDAIDARYGALAPRPDRPVTAFEIAPRATSGEGVMILTRTEDHHLQTPRGFYTPVLDPWVELAAQCWPVRKVEVPGPRFAATQPRVHATEALRFESLDNPRLDRLQELRDTARLLALTITKWLTEEIGFSYPTFGAELDAFVTGLWVEKEQLLSLLAAKPPRLLLTTCTYFRPTMSMAWAARELNIPIADVQHGGNGPFHTGYTHWRSVPPTGYKAQPDLFFCWDAISANNIGRWLPENAGSSIAVTGRFDLDTTRRAYLGDTTRSPLDLVTFGSAKIVLVTLQWLPSTGLTPLLLEAMRKAPPDWTWLIRSHPMAVSWNRTDLMPDAIEAALRAHGIVRAESRFSTALPLAVILPLVHHHVTGFSGTVQECAAYGIGTTFTHGAARFSFPSYLDSGIADFATSAGDILQSIGRSSSDRTIISDMPRDPDRALRVLERILG